MPIFMCCFLLERIALPGGFCTIAGNPQVLPITPIPDALAFARRAGDAGLDFFEQPVRGTDIAAMQACVAAASIPIGADEGLHRLADIERHHALGAAAGGSLKLIKLGGAFQVITASGLMQRLGMHVNLAGKAADSSIGSAAVAHLALALPLLDWDCNITSPYPADDIVETPMAVVDGTS
jgi:muconate cycloisomerase